MELFTLRLGAPLSWTPATCTLIDVDPAAILTQEGSEAVFLWNREQLVADSDDGPRLRLPLPPPLQTGLSETSNDTMVDTPRIELPAASYLFCQGRLKDLPSIEQTLEWFFRETWWTRAECRGPVYLRLIREDRKTAVQVIMESAKQE